MQRPDPASAAARALGLALLLWSVPLASALLVRAGLSPTAALFAAFLVATGVSEASRQRRRVCVVRLGLGGLAGLASYPAWLAGIAGTGLALGLQPGAPVPPGAGTPLLWITTLGLAPLFEERGYRQRLLPALEPLIGSAGAIALSSLLFALPHLEPWNVLAAFGVGIALGTLMKLAGSLSLCVGFHAGLNLAALLRGVPPVCG